MAQHEALYQKDHTSARSSVERALGQLKLRWRYIYIDLHLTNVECENLHALVGYLNVIEIYFQLHLYFFSAACIILFFLWWGGGGLSKNWYLWLETIPPTLFLSQVPVQAQCWHFGHDATVGFMGRDRMLHSTQLVR